MRVFLRVCRDLRWPVTLGLIIGMSYLLVREQRALQQGVPGTQTVNANQARATFNEGDIAYQRGQSYAKAVQRAAPSVVNIYTSKRIVSRINPLFNDPLLRYFFNQADLPRQQRMESSMGSGVIVSDEGYLLTNYHVVSGVDEIVVALYDGRDANATVVGTNEENDLAVLKIELDNIQAIAVGRPESAQVGDVVLAIGNPFGMGQTVTQGIVSATRRRGFNISLFENFIQTDAAINPGNSGGALIDTEGRLIGINTANLNPEGSSSGISFAIPADTAMQTLEDIINFGRVVRGWLGIEARTLAATGNQSAQGILVTAVYKNSPAHKAGILPGDMITQINEQEIGSGRWGVQEIAESRPGETVRIALVRGQEMFHVKATLIAKPVEKSK